MNTQSESAVQAPAAEQRVKELLAEVLQMPPAAITDELAMKDVDAWDSLKHIELIVSLEQSFDIQLTFDDIVAMQSVRDINRVLKERKASG
jgi:acyl carrier protein